MHKIPNGFVHLKDNTHLKVLKWIFTEEEARIASQMRLRGETLEELAKRLKEPKEKLNSLLETMHKKGQIRAWNSSTGRRYMLIPFAVGIYEEQLDRMDAEFAQLMEEYFQKGGEPDLVVDKPGKGVLGELSKGQRSALNELGERLSSKAMKEDEIYDVFWEISKKHGLTAPQFFNAAYNVLINKSSGPRLAPFIIAIGQERVAKILGSL